MNYSDIQEHVEAGNKPATIANLLKADTRHMRDVMATSSSPNETDLLDVLGEYGLLYIQPDATWAGPLVGAVAAVADDTLTAGFNRLLTNLQLTNRPVKCGTSAAIGYLVTVLTGLAQQSQPSMSSAIVAAMDALTGGVRFAGVTESDVQTCIDEEVARVQAEADAQAEMEAAQALATIRMELQEQLQPLLNTHVYSVIDGDDPTATKLVAGLRLVADGLEA